MSARIQFCGQCGSPLESRVVEKEGISRLRCSKKDCSFIFYNNPLPVVAAIVEQNNELILARNVSWPESWFALITGFLEAKEDPRAGIIREVKEEIGLDVEIVSLVGVYPFPSKNELIICYHVRALDAHQPVKLDPREIAAIRRVAPHRLRPWAGPTGQAVKDWMLARAKHISSGSIAASVPTTAHPMNVAGVNFSSSSSSLNSKL